MSSYSSNPAGLGVGKRYGQLFAGGMSGHYRGDGAEREIIVEIAAFETPTGGPMTVAVPDNYLIDAIWLEVETAFAASSTINLSVKGGAALTTPMNLAVQAPLAVIALTGLANLSSTTGGNIVFTPNANAIASTVGKARILVRYRAV
jgi:hypothetical protein